jgi:mannose-1-phosphate guanylyltransferase
MKITPLIMCGGAGTRLWPASREGRPKQFLRLFGPYSTFQETVRRVSDPSVFDKPIVLTNADYRFLVLEELAEIGIEAEIALEPMRRDSGPAIAAGAVLAARRDPKTVVLALAADHLVTDVAGFVDACRDGLPAAESGRIVTFGVTPDHPATGYGYIQPGAPIGGRARARSLQGEARRRNGRALYRRRLSVEQRQLHVPRRCVARRISQGRCGKRCGGN